IEIGRQNPAAIELRARPRAEESRRRLWPGRDCGPAHLIAGALAAALAGGAAWRGLVGGVWRCTPGFSGTPRLAFARGRAFATTRRRFDVAVGKSILTGQRQIRRGLGRNDVR